MKRWIVPTALLLCWLLPAPDRAFGQDDLQQKQADSEASRKVLNRVVPLYPGLARSLNVKGIVRIEALVGPNGQVKSLDVKGGHPLLIESAQSAVRKWKWQPAQHESKETIEIRFDPDK
jgi:TonB family protein